MYIHILGMDFDGGFNILFGLVDIPPTPILWAQPTSTTTTTNNNNNNNWRFPLFILLLLVGGGLLVTVPHCGLATNLQFNQ